VGDARAAQPHHGRAAREPSHAATHGADEALLTGHPPEGDEREEAQGGRELEGHAAIEDDQQREETERGDQGRDAASRGVAWAPHRMDGTDRLAPSPVGVSSLP
jgi:hypothetical protein